MTYLTEAVFANGKKTMAPIEKQFQVCKDELQNMIQNEKTEFDPEEYWRMQCWKDLEDKIQKAFGFRSVTLMPWNEKYDRSSGKFETKEMSVEVSYHRRYPIDGLVTDKGFYDKSHSLAFTVMISLGTIKSLTAAELTACMLHEFGHVVDPALMDIHYAEANALAKYMTDRQSKLNDGEKKALKGKKGLSAVFASLGLLFIAGGVATLITCITAFIRSHFRKNRPNGNPEKVIQKIKEKLREEAQVNRTTNEEAYADDFARMYGYGAQLGSALMKIQKHTNSEIRSRISREKDRQKAIAHMFMAVIDDEHKTDVQRIKALIKEYHKDINDPNTPAVTKKQLEEDVAELEKVLDEYLNNFDELSNRINRMIVEAVDAEDGKEKDDSEEITEGVEDAYLTEASRGRLKVDYRYAKDRRTGHKCLMIYSLDGIQIAAIGRDAITAMYRDYQIQCQQAGIKSKKYDAFCREYDSVDPETGEPTSDRKKYMMDVQRNIKKTGNTDHCSYGQKLLDILDLDDFDTKDGQVRYKHLKEIEMEAPYRSGSEIRRIKVGDVEPKEFPTFKTTHWNSLHQHDPKKAAQVSHHEIWRNIASEEIKGNRRGEAAKLHGKTPAFDQDTKHYIDWAGSTTDSTLDSVDEGKVKELVRREITDRNVATRVTRADIAYIAKECKRKSSYTWAERVKVGGVIAKNGDEAKLRKMVAELQEKIKVEIKYEQEHRIKRGEADLAFCHFTDTKYRNMAESSYWGDMDEDLGSSCIIDHPE